MRKLFQFLSMISLLTLAVAHAPALADSPDRDALLKAAVARDRGAITTLEALGDSSQSVAVGYASGAVLVCHGQSRCTEFGGTPNAAVEHLAVSGTGDSPVIWVSYSQGALYRCSGRTCARFQWDVANTQ